MATLYWDPDGIPGNNNVATGAGLGGSGTWSNAPIACWFNPATGKNVAWTNAAGDVAVFTGPPQIPDKPVASGTVNVSGSVSCAEAWFQSNFYSLQSEAAQPGSISLPASGTSISVSTGMGATIDVPITGSGTLSKGGEGLLVLTANETYTGATKVLAGTLDVRGNLASHVTASGGTVAGLVFFDPDLAAAVRETLGMSVDTVLTPSKVAGLSALTVDSNKISDLTGLNPANTPNLAALSLLPGDFSATPAGLTSLAPLAGLAKLKTLAIQHVGVTDAVLEKTLPSLPALDTLDVRFNAIGVIPANVAGLPGLSTLLVHGNPLLADTPRNGLINLKGRPIDVDVAADGPETATTVADLAASLYFLPQKMLEYVTNTVAFQSYVGLMKGPLATLQTKAGNDWDTNALLAGLFNAAGIETRFVSGSIKVTEKQVMDYVGARDVTAAANILSKAGIAGGIGTLTHAWMEASVRLPGVAAEAWLPLDASWKFRDFRPGVAGILENVPFSPVETDYLTNPSWQTKTTAEYYESKVAAWLAANRPGVTTVDVAYNGPIRQQSFSKLPEGLPYEVATSVAATAPTHTVTIELTNSGEVASGATIKQGSSLYSPNGAYRLSVEANGRVALYQYSTAIWTNNVNVSSTDTKLLFQQDGNLSVTTGAAVVWKTSVGNYPGSRLCVQDDGNLVIYSAQNTALWSTNTARPLLNLSPSVLMSKTLTLSEIACVRITVDPNLNGSS